MGGGVNPFLLHHVWQYCIAALSRNAKITGRPIWQASELSGEYDRRLEIAKIRLMGEYWYGKTVMVVAAFKACIPLLAAHRVCRISYHV